LGKFDELRQKTDADALAILKEAATNPKYKSDIDQGKAINLYKTDTIGRTN
jgi:endothelin-converting enzyme/putative endopeptidase